MLYHHIIFYLFWQATILSLPPFNHSKHHSFFLVPPCFMSSCKAQHYLCILITDKFKGRYLDLIVKSSFAASQKLPGPHEVVFYSETEDSPGVMLWRYPEPRVLTFVRITPVPFNTTEDPEISTADLGDVLQVGGDAQLLI